MTTTVNYSDDQIERMTSVYTSADTDADRKEAVTILADEFGKTVNSIRAKLAGLKVYIKPAKTTKAGVISVRKAELVAQIAVKLGKDEETLSSLESATKTALQTVLDGLS